MREGLFMLGASCGIDSPTKFTHQHIALRESNNNVRKMQSFYVEKPPTDVTTLDNSKEKKEKEIVS